MVTTPWRPDCVSEDGDSTIEMTVRCVYRFSDMHVRTIPSVLYLPCAIAQLKDDGSL